MERTYAIKEILDWFSNYNKNDVIIKTPSKEFEIEIKNSNLPHLLGLHYSSDRPLKGRRLYSAIKNLSDEAIFRNVEKHNPNRLELVKSRVHYFKFFMENLENAYLYQQTHPETKLKSDYLLVDTQDGNYLQLGIGNNGLEDYLETFIVRHDDRYFKDSTIKEQVEGLYRLDELMIPVPFSFDVEKNRVLEEERRRKIEQALYKDSDLDGLVDSLELAMGTSPYAVDTDGDGKSDVTEYASPDSPIIPDKKQELQDVIEQSQKEAKSPDNYTSDKAINKEREL
ncbi:MULTISPECIES: PBECR4 domain-containing protein [Streptococcus]|uniref:PBECR4 domain-containing protein n=1 Tax=Streptococcus TaxID=1301 RepID=UPI0015526B94|nr:hypothetical protein [Streptococcus suis]HEL1757004.1 hypothetical protein [Streptococcus suis]HEM6022158.1 hypothetical protein [Streptococcus suis]HEM6037591.1 hypothetical protein [Streptococcus suis]